MAQVNKKAKPMGSLHNRTAEDVVRMIDKLGAATLQKEQAVYDAETAYYYLSAVEKAKVTNLPKLHSALDNLRRLYIGPKEGKRLDRTKLCIGAYCFANYCWTDEHVKALADCKIQYLCSVPNDVKLLDLLAKYGVVADVGHLPGWWGGGSAGNNGKMAELRPLSLYEEKAKEFKDHPAIWAVAISDEASCLDFPHHGKVVELVRKGFPNQLPYINLQNAGPGFDDMGAPTFDEYIESYMKNIPLDYVSYDHYMYSWGVDRAFLAYDAASRLSRAHGKDFWVVLQVNREGHRPPITLRMLRFQAYSALVYGAKAITWACWTAGWWDDNVVDKEGNLSDRYDLLKEINTELSSLSPVYMWYDHVETFFVDGGSSALPVRFYLDRDGAVPTGTQTVFTHLKTPDKTAVQAGFFAKKNGRGHGLMLLSAEDPWGDANFHTPDSLKKTPVTFRVSTPDVRVSAYCQGKPIEIAPDTYGNYTVVLEENNAVFVTVEEN